MNNFLEVYAEELEDCKDIYNIYNLTTQEYIYSLSFGHFLGGVNPGIYLEIHADFSPEETAYKWFHCCQNGKWCRCSIVHPNEKKIKQIGIKEYLEGERQWKEKEV